VVQVYESLTTSRPPHPPPPECVHEYNVISRVCSCLILLISLKFLYRGVCDLGGCYLGSSGGAALSQVARSALGRHL